MRACVVAGAGNLRIENVEERALEAGEVRLALAYGGICGSDLHYYRHGRVANSIIYQPMVLGHEFSATVVEIAPDSALKPGDKVAVNPSKPCGECEYCRGNDNHLCQNMRFMGSAARRPHEMGGFNERPVVNEWQCIAVPADTDLRLLALCEPYAVALHGVSRAGDIRGLEVLVTGAGPIGILVALAARQAGAARVVITDIVDGALHKAAEIAGAIPVNVSTREGIAQVEELCGDRVTVVYEASGAPQAFALAMNCIRKKGIFVQVGFMPPDAQINTAPVLIKELSMTGAYRFSSEFDEAVRRVVSGEVDLSAMLTASYTFDDVLVAMDAAADKQNHVKVTLEFA